MDRTAENFWEKRWSPRFLKRLRHRSLAKRHCREAISGLVRSGDASSILEVAFGALHERRALAGLFKEFPDLLYSGVELHQTAVSYAKKLFPEHAFRVADITRDKPTSRADIVYAVHVLEHCKGLTPALDFILRSAKQKAFVVFFHSLSTKTATKKLYGGQVWNNQWSRTGVESICRAHGFLCKLTDFDNASIATKRGPRYETVMEATRQ